MKIFNEDSQHKVKFYKLIYFVLLSTSIAVLYATRLFDTNFPQIKKDYFLILFISLYIIVNLIRLAMRYSYFYFDDETPNLIFRFFHLVPFGAKRLAFSIPKKAFHDFKVVKKIFGFRKDLILYQKNKEKIIAYPPISLTAVSKKDTKLLLSRLEVLKTNKH